MMKAIRKLALACAVLALGAPAAAAQGWSCKNAWAHLPALNPVASYKSPNDPDPTYSNLGPGEDWSQSLTNAAIGFAEIRSALTGWQSRMEMAERAFWQDFDDDGVVARERHNELAYWYHKRENWSAIRTGFGVHLRQGVGGGADQVFSLIMGGNSQEYFNPPRGGGFRGVSRTGADLGVVTSDAEYKAYMNALLQYSFLRQSSCAPARQQTAEGRVLHELLYPRYNVSDAQSKWDSILAWAGQSAGRMSELDTLLAGLTADQKLKSGGWGIISGAIENGSTSVADVQFEEYKLHVDRLRVLNYIKLAKAETSAGGFALAYTDEDSFPRGRIDIQGATLEQVQQCIIDNWDTIVRYYFDRTSSNGMSYVLNPSMAGIQYKKHLGYAAVLGCGSADGLDNERVAQMIATYAN